MRAGALSGLMNELPELAIDAWRQSQCSTSKRCNRATCLHCGFRTPHPGSKTPPNHHDQSDGKPKRKYQKNGSRNRISTVAKTMLKPFEKLDEAKTFALTINVLFAHPDDDFQALGSYWRKQIMEFIAEEMPEATFKMMMDIAPSDIASIPPNYPDDAISDALPLNGSGSHPTLLLHVHGFVHHPTLTRGEVAKPFRKRFPGERRVAMSNPVPVEVDAEGFETGGMLGWAEYAAMEKIEVDYACSLEGYSAEGLSDPTTGPWDNVRVSAALILARKKWKRQARWITFKPAVDVHEEQSTQTKAVTRSLSDLRSSTWLKSHLDDLTGIDELFRDYSDGLGTPVVSKAKPVPADEHHDHHQATIRRLFPYNCMVGCTLAIPYVSLGIADLPTGRMCSRPGIEKPP